MSIQEKKSAKGIPYAIVKFSDKDAEFELSYLLKLVSNEKIERIWVIRSHIAKDKIIGDNTKKDQHKKDLEFTRRNYQTLHKSNYRVEKIVI